MLSRRARSYIPTLGNSLFLTALTLMMPSVWLEKPLMEAQRYVKRSVNASQSGVQVPKSRLDNRSSASRAEGSSFSSKLFAKGREKTSLRRLIDEESADYEDIFPLRGHERPRESENGITPGNKTIGRS